MNFNLVTFIAGLLDGLVDSFKLKNPKAFMVVALVLFVAFQAIDYLLASGQVQEVYLTFFGITVPVLGTVKGLIVALGFVSGAHTPKPTAIAIVADWVRFAEYQPGDVVSISGGNFKCIQAHKADYENGPFNPNKGAEYWEPVAPIA